MTRREEVFMLFMTGVLLAFGFNGQARQRQTATARQEKDQAARELQSYWQAVGGYINAAMQEHAAKQQGAQAAR
ncbi:MAG: hypothetical protein JST38_08855 [Bacteroidetes bacterium]|nr:hypothetical protein [Bacteroidota bacterium]